MNNPAIYLMLRGIFVIRRLLMSTSHRGNVINEITQEEHNGTLNAKRVDASTATIYAVVNTESGTETVSLASVFTGVNIGVSWDSGATVAVSNLPSHIGTATVFAGANFPVTWTSGATVGVSSLPAHIGTATVFAGANFPVTITSGTTIAVSDLPNVTVANQNRTWLQQNFGLFQDGNATIFVPSARFNIAHMVLGTDTACQLAILSGGTYLAGNASIGIPLAANGGFVRDGGEFSPVFRGLASGNAFVINSNVTAKIGGHVIYWED